jgi:IS30 family transposase
MGRRYEQLSLEERCTLSRLKQAGKTVRQIAAIMDRAPSTIARELKRNSGTKVGYQPAYAEQQAKSRCWRGSRLLRQPELQNEVLKRLGYGWSPSQVAGRLNTEKKRKVISYESIYRLRDSPNQRLQLAPLPPPGQEQARLAWTQRWQGGRSHRGAHGDRSAPGLDRQTAPSGPLERRPDAFCQTWSGCLGRS